MRTLLQLAATLLLTGATATPAQITNPDTLVAPPPRNPAIHKPASTQDLQWLWQFTTGDKQALLTDERFKHLLADNLKAPQAFWHIGTPLSDAAQLFLSGPGTITSTGNRYVAITGCVPDQCAQRGLLYADLGARDPLLLFAALRWNEQSQTSDAPNAPFTLWLFPSRTLDNPQQLPEPIAHALRTWLFAPGHCHPLNITSVLVVDPNGVPHIETPMTLGLTQGPCTPLTPGTHS
ncbi:MAG: hypothetical protein V4555_16290 [Acidobacteriota bacterium]